MENRKFLAWAIIVGFSILCAELVFFYYLPYQGELEALADGYVIKATARYGSALDGLAVTKRADINPQVIAVMIDNHPDARPEYGLSEAKIVYEAPVEGEFTRYMAIFDSTQNVLQVGPVRSARPYFLDWLQEYGGGLYMHSGGSPDALSLIDQRNIFDANEFYRGDYYWRGSDRLAPHNLYTKSDFWQALISKYATSTDKMQTSSAWKFSATIAQPSDAQNAIKIAYNQDYVVSWNYDPAAMNYVRYINGVKYTDADGSEVRARNILVQYVSVGVLDNEGRKAIATVGSGDARVLRKGAVIQASWTKKSLTDRTRFYAAGNLNSEIILLPGATWVEVVPQNASVTISD